MKHRISQPDGIEDSCVGDTEEDDTVNLVLGGIFRVPLKHSATLQSHSHEGWCWPQRKKTFHGMKW